MVRHRTPRPERGATGDEISPEDRALIAAAIDTLRDRYVTGRHTVGAAVRTRSGAVFTGVNIEGIHTPCAEPVAVGAAISAGERALAAMVAVCRRGRTYPLLSPCGTCRQLLLDYGPTAYAIVADRSGRARRLGAREALPYPFETFGR